MPAFICTACGAQYPPSDKPPARCAICQDERQYVPPGGQTWTTLDALAGRHFNSFREHEPGLIGIGSQPAVAIGQRALLVCTPSGNVLWDCISLIDAATVTLIKGLGADHIIWGTDSVWTGSPQWQIEAMRRLEIPEEMQKKYGFKPLGPADGPVKNAILGENGLRIFGYNKKAELGRPTGKSTTRFST